MDLQQHLQHIIFSTSVSTHLALFPQGSVVLTHLPMGASMPDTCNLSISRVGPCLCLSLPYTAMIFPLSISHFPLHLLCYKDFTTPKNLQGKEMQTIPSDAKSPANDLLRNERGTAVAFSAKQSKARRGQQLREKICHLVKLSFPRPHGFRHYNPHWAVHKHIHNTVRHTWCWSLLAGYIRVIIFSPCFLYSSLSICCLPLLDTGYQAVSNCYVKEINGPYKGKKG